jgi:hypothetical protein
MELRRGKGSADLLPPQGAGCLPRYFGTQR